MKNYTKNLLLILTLGASLAPATGMAMQLKLSEYKKGFSNFLIALQEEKPDDELFDIIHQDQNHTEKHLEKDKNRADLCVNDKQTRRVVEIINTAIFSEEFNPKILHKLLENDRFKRILIQEYNVTKLINHSMRKNDLLTLEKFLAHKEIRNIYLQNDPKLKNLDEAVYKTNHRLFNIGKEVKYNANILRIFIKHNDLREAYRNAFAKITAFIIGESECLDLIKEHLKYSDLRPVFTSHSKIPNHAVTEAIKRNRPDILQELLIYPEIREMLTQENMEKATSFPEIEKMLREQEESREQEEPDEALDYLDHLHRNNCKIM